MLDPYKVLNVDHDASFETIKSAYLNLVKKHHPDLNSNADSEKIKEITHAYSILKDENLKNNHDNIVNDQKYYENVYHFYVVKQKYTKENTDIFHEIRLKCNHELFMDKEIMIDYDKHVFCSECYGHGEYYIKGDVKCDECNGSGYDDTEYVKRKCTKCGKKNKQTCEKCYGSGITAVKLSKKINIKYDFINKYIVYKLEGNQEYPYQEPGNLVIKVNLDSDCFRIDENGNALIDVVIYDDMPCYVYFIMGLDRELQTITWPIDFQDGYSVTLYNKGIYINNRERGNIICIFHKNNDNYKISTMHKGPSNVLSAIVMC